MKKTTGEQVACVLVDRGRIRKGGETGTSHTKTRRIENHLYQIFEPKPTGMIRPHIGRGSAKRRSRIGRVNRESDAKTQRGDPDGSKSKILKHFHEAQGE